MPRRRVLVVDDDANIVQLVRMYLEKDGYQAAVAYDGEEALEAAHSFKPDLIVLDLMLPRIDGLEVCKRLRVESQVPIIMLTARTTETDKLLGLDLGADDYVTKPFSPGELLARIRAVLRRAPSTDELSGPEEVVVGPLVIRPGRREVVVQERPVRLTPTEFNLLKVMALAPGQVFTRAQLIEKAFGYGFEGFERNVDVHITSLRRKLELDGGKRHLIRTVYRLGYKLEPGEVAERSTAGKESDSDSDGDRSIKAHA